VEEKYILWPLVNIPQIPKAILYRLAREVMSSKDGKARKLLSDQMSSGMSVYSPDKHAQASTAPPLEDTYSEEFGERQGLPLTSERLNQIVELHMTRQFSSSWNKQRSESKAVLFLLDASGSMAGSRLHICKESLKSILENFISDEDYVGFIAFASYTKVVFEMMLKQGKLRLMLERLNQLDVFGATKFYDAVLEAVQMLAKVESNNRWIIALTDGEDTGSRVDAHGTAASKIIEEARLNFACITVGKLPAESMEIINGYVSSAADGMHVEASDTVKIAAAFKEVAHVLEGGLNECL